MGKCIQESQQILRNATLQRIFPQDTSNISVFQSGFMVELMKERGKIGAMSLLVHLLPATGEPVAMNVNNRRTQLTSLKSTVYISNPGTKEKVAFNFTDELRQDRIKDCSSVIGDKSIHYFMSGVKSWLFAEEDFHGVTEYSHLLQSWAPLRWRKQGSNRPDSSSFQLAVADQDFCKIDQDDINALHYLLNIGEVYPDGHVLVGGRITEPIALFFKVFEKLNNIPLYDARDMRDFIKSDMAIPLFDNVSTDTIIPIWLQWTKLSYFLQMSCRICFSPIEGGHRTWEFIKFYTGAAFDELTPQPLTHDKPIVPHEYMQPRGISQADYKFHVWHPTSHWEHIDKSCANQLRIESFEIKQRQDIQCEDTYVEFFETVINKVDELFIGYKQFTTKDLFKDFVAGLQRMDKRLTIISKAVLRLFKTKLPMKQIWEEFTDTTQSDYAGQSSLANMKVNFLIHALVSFNNWAK